MRASRSHPDRCQPGVNARVYSTTTTLNLTGTRTTTAIYAFIVKVTGCGGAVSRVSYKVVIRGTANHVVGFSCLHVNRKAVSLGKGIKKGRHSSRTASCLREVVAVFCLQFRTATRSWVSFGKPTFGPSRPHLLHCA